MVVVDRSVVTITIDPGREFNMYSPSVNFVQFMVRDERNTEFCIGFYGKGKKEQQNFFYNPRITQKILRQTSAGISMDCHISDILKPGKYKIWIRAGFANGKIGLGGAEEIIVR